MGIFRSFASNPLTPSRLSAFSVGSRSVPGFLNTKLPIMNPTTLSTMNNYHSRLARPLHKRLLRNGSSAAQRARRSAGVSARTKSSAWKSGPFVSVLSSPFVPWNDLEIVIGEYFPEWSLTHRSYIVQHLVRFLELKVLTEEFATDKALLDPTPLVALAWQAVIHDSRLYLRTIHDIQEFHGRPTQMLKLSLPPNEFNAGKKVDPERLDRTQVLFQAYYCERMIESLEEADADMALEDTSAITDHFLLRCGPAADQNILAKSPTSAMKKKSKKAQDKSIKGTMVWPCAPSTLMDVIGDLLFFDEGEEKSQEKSVVMEEIEEEEEKREVVQPYERPEDVFHADAEGADYDSSFTLDFFHTRSFLCRQASRKDLVEEEGCRVYDSSSPVFQW